MESLPTDKGHVGGHCNRCGTKISGWWGIYKLCNYCVALSPKAFIYRSEVSIRGSLPIDNSPNRIPGKFK